MTFGDVAAVVFVVLFLWFTCSGDGNDGADDWEVDERWNRSQRWRDEEDEL